MEYLTRKLADPDNPRSASARARYRRSEQFMQQFPHIGQMRVLDLGGTPDYWLSSPFSPAAVTIVNLAHYVSYGIVTAVQGDACDPPARVQAERFDCVVSNSLIEHVGGHVRRQRLSDVIHSRSDRHWIQTPYRYFPIEPHWLFPGLQFLPFPARVWVTRRWPLGHMQISGRAAVDAVSEVELLTLTQMRSYFPESSIWFERFAGLPKSLVAISA